MPIDKKSLYLFAFTWKNQQYILDSYASKIHRGPFIFSQILPQDLSTLQFPRHSIFTQYVDDLLFHVSSRENSETDSKYLLLQLAYKDHKASQGKLQFS